MKNNDIFITATYYSEFSSYDNILKRDIISVKKGVAFITNLPYLINSNISWLLQFSGYSEVDAFVTDLPNNLRVGDLVQFLNKSKNISGMTLQSSRDENEITKDYCQIMFVWEK